MNEADRAALRYAATLHAEAIGYRDARHQYAAQRYARDVHAISAAVVPLAAHHLTATRPEIRRITGDVLRDHYGTWAYATPYTDWPSDDGIWRDGTRRTTHAPPTT